MTKRIRVGSQLFAVIALIAAMATGCGSSTETGKSSGGPPAVADAAKEGDHSGWWCAEHGIPEEDCSMCSADAAAKFKEKGDWCKEHNRAESQCFVCDPSRAEKFAKLYEAKFGEKPPKRTE